MGPLGSWTVIDKADAVDAMASYLAAWLSQTPEAQNLDPLQLQAALLESIKVSHELQPRCCHSCSPC